MKYKIGDKVKIGKNYPDFGHDAFLSKYNYILTVKDLDDSFYFMEEDNFWYLESSIESLYVEKINPIESRFEILDIR